MRKAASFFVVFVFAVVFLLWSFSPRAELAVQEDQVEGLPNYDIRVDKDANAREAIGKFTEQSTKSALVISRDRKKALEAADDLRRQDGDLKIEYNDDLQIPETISRGTKFLTAPAGKKRAAILKDFIASNADLFGLDQRQIAALEKTADYTNPDGNLSFVHFEQKINSIPVFQGEIKAGFTRKNQIARIINNLAPSLDYETLPLSGTSAERAVFDAAKYINFQTNPDDTRRIESKSNDLKVTFERGRFAGETIAEKIYFPIDYGVARLAWRVYLWTQTAAFSVVVDAEDGTLLWRQNNTNDQTQPATYNVYGNAASFIKTGDSPTAFTPGCLNPNTCPSPPPIVSRQTFTLIGNEPPYQFNLNGWIPDGENRTIGNNAEAGIDRDGTNGIDPNGWAFGSPARNFVYTYNPAPGNPPPGEEPIPVPQTYPPSAFQQGSITNAFYTVNRFHDEMYRFGFTEPARNFQTDNFGQGGLGNDSISIEVQDGSGTNGANFTTPPDGGRPRLQLFVWTTPTPDIDGALDNQAIVHEITHGVSSRLHGNGTGLGGQGGMMGEGWSDFYALALMSESTDDPNGTYSIGCYTVSGLFNCYYGLRRFPVARKASVGANGLPHSPLTFRHINIDCDNFIGTTTTNPISAFPRNPAIATSGNCSQVHNAGEIWAVALWEVRGKFIDRLGWAEGNRRVLQFVTDGMKLAPLNPTFLQERDAIIAAANASGTADDVRDIWAGFAIRGMGFSAQVLSISNVVEAFDTPNIVQTPNFTFTEIAGNMDGYPMPGETLRLTIPLTNNTGVPATGVTLQIQGGGSASYGDIAHGQTVTRQIDFTIPFNASCPGNFPLIFNIDSSAGSRVENRSVFLGVPLGTPVTFTNSSPITINDASAATPYPSTITASGVTGSRRIKVELTGLTHTYPDDIDILLVGPGGQKFVIMSDVGSGNDVSNINVSLIDSAANPLPAMNLTSGEYRPGNNASGDSFPLPAPAPPYLLPAPAGTATFASAFGNSGASFNGTWSLYIVDDAGSDFGSLAGWKLTFEPDFVCPICLTSCLGKQRADFDGDGKTDVSVFRPSGGTWYVYGSTSGVTAVNWGLSTDTPVPADFDGDSKTDYAVFRPTSDDGPDFYILNSSNFTFSGYAWGLPGDFPMVEDYDGDGRDDIAVYRPANGTFYALKSQNGGVLQNYRDFPLDSKYVTGDFDGDGRGDITSFKDGQWRIAKSSNNYAAAELHNWGLTNDLPVIADYDGDNIDDLAVFRPSDSVWYVRKSTGGNLIVQFGISTDIPAPGDYDGDGKYDIAVYRDGTWYLNRSTLGLLITQFGLNGDMPIPNRYLP